MNFWRATDGATPAAAVAATTPTAPIAAEAYELAAVDLYLTYGHRRGWIATNGQRTSDWLNANDPLSVRGLTAVDSAEPDGMPPTVDSAAAADVTTVPAEDILFVIPPPLPQNRHLRLHRRRVHVDVRIGDVAIGGQAHIRPGAEVGEHIFRSGRRFVPLTDVEVILNDDSPAWPLPVVIINSAVVREIRGIQEKKATAAPTPAAVEAVQAAEAPTPIAPAPKDQPTPPEPAPEALTSRDMILLTALELLLAEGVIDIVEFQTKRAGLVRK